MRKLILGLMIIGAFAAYGADVVTKYPAQQYGTLDAISSADTASLTSTAYNTRTVIQPNGCKNLTISASFSVAAATASIGIIWGQVDPATGYFKPDSAAPGDWATFTADSTFTVNGRYVSKSAAFDSQNRKAGIIYVRTISSGSVLPGWSLH